MATGFFFINLDRDGDRRTHMAQCAARMGLDFVRVPAVDLARLAESPSDAFRPYRYRNERWTLRPFEMAVFESHRKAWKTFLGTQHAFAVIMEDDMLFAPEFAETVRSLQSGATPVFDLVKLNHSAQRRRMGPLQHLPSGLALRKIHENIADAGCYLLTRQTAERLLSASQNYCAHVDDFIFSPDRGLRSYQLFPPVSAQMLYFEDAARRLASVSSRLEQTDRAIKGPLTFRLWKELRRLGKKGERLVLSGLQKGEHVDMPALLSAFRPMDRP